MIFPKIILILVTSSYSNGNVFSFLYPTSKNLEKQKCQKLVNEGNCTVIGSPSVKINSKEPCIFTCKYDPSKINVGLFRFYVHLYSSSANATVSISARQDSGITSWNLPQTFAEDGASQRFQTIEEVLCPSRERKNDTVYFRMETSSMENVVMNISLHRTPYVIQFNKPVQVTTSPVSSWFKFYDWNAQERGSSVLVKAKNIGKKGKSVCAYLAIQNAQCPVASTKASIISGKTRYLSFQRQGGMVARRSDYPDGIFIIVLPMPSNEPCTGISEEFENITTRRKTVELTVLSHKTVAENWASFFFFGVLIVAVLIVHSVLFKRAIYRVPTYERLSASEDGAADDAMSNRGLGVVIGDLSNSDVFREPTRDSNRHRSHSETLPLELEDDDYQTVDGEAQQQSERPQQQQQEQPPLFLLPSLRNPSDNEQEPLMPRSSLPGCDNSENETREPDGRTSGLENLRNNEGSPHVLPLSLVEFNPCSSPMYMAWWMKVTEATHTKLRNSTFEGGFYTYLVIIAVFMTLAMFLILKNLLHSYNDGSEDMCYFNTMCMSSLWIFPNFAPVFSNLAYIVCGISLYHNLNVHQKWRHSKSSTNGVYKCYNVFKGLAVGLILVGLMSSFYHICPNRVTFPFDMMFICLEALILIIVNWGLRHGTVIGHVLSTICFFAGTLLAAEIKNFIQCQIFWTFIIIIHFSIAIAVATMLCKFGTWTFSPVSIYWFFNEWNNMPDNFKTLFREEIERTPHSKKHWTIFRTLFGFFANIGLIITAPVLDLNLYYYILLTCVINMVVYLLNYIFTKTYICKEKGSIFSWIYLSVGAFLWGVAVYFLFIHNSDVETTPSTSHSINVGCRLFNVFSAHDIWHVASAFAMYFTILGILTLDDDMIEVDPQRIPVF